MNDPVDPGLSNDDLDVAAINADDALLDLLGRRGAGVLGVGADLFEVPVELSDGMLWADAPLARTPSNDDDAALRILAAVLRDTDDGFAQAERRIRTAEAAELGDILPTLTGDTGAVVLRPSGSSWGRRGARHSARGIAAAAAVVVSLGGVAAASVGAEPGHPLYPVHRVFAGPDPVAEQAHAVREVAKALTEAETALGAGDVSRAHGKARAAAERLAEITDPAVAKALAERTDVVGAAVAAADPTLPDTRPVAAGPNPPVEAPKAAEPSAQAPEAPPVVTSPGAGTPSLGLPSAESPATGSGTSSSAPATGSASGSPGASSPASSRPVIPERADSESEARDRARIRDKREKEKKERDKDRDEATATPTASPTPTASSSPTPRPTVTSPVLPGEIDSKGTGATPLTGVDALD